ncbi:MAG: hypothetical protein ACFFER_19255 [Candidatus Thorarchaeota archaeon]
MKCFVHGYVGPGITIRNLLRTAGNLVQRTRLGYGMVIWQDFNMEPVRIRRTTVWDLFFDEGPNGIADGYVVEQLEEEGLSLTDRVQMGMIHGRWATSGDIDTFPDNNCHPYRIAYKGELLYYVHNGHLENWASYYNDLAFANLPPEAETDSATCGALLARDILLNNENCISASRNLIHTLESTQSSGALLFVYDMEPERMYALRVDMPLVVIRSRLGCFLSSDVNVLKGLSDRKVEVYCVRSGALGWVDADQQIQLMDSHGQYSFGHYGKMYLEKRKISRLEGLKSCRKTIDQGHQIEMWDKRTIAKWSLWNAENRCLSCACEIREDIERQSNQSFELSNLCPIDL